MAKHNILGEKGEEAACLYLVRKGYEILARNVSMYGAEIDIVAEYHGTIAFVEVKTRSRASEEEALAAVNHEKRIRIIAAARSFMAQFPPCKRIRFDVITCLGADHPFSVDHHRGWFNLSEVMRKWRR